MQPNDKNAPSLFDVLRADPCDLDGVRAAIRAGADVNEVDDCGDVLKEAVAAWHDRVSMEVVRLLVKSGANIRYRNDEGCNALTSAVSRQEPDLVACLLSLGSDPNVIIERGAESLLDSAEFDLYHHSELTDDPESEIDARAGKALTAIIEQLKAAGAKRLSELSGSAGQAQSG